MIKTFEQFINENYNEIKPVAIGEEYGASLFNEISESLISEISNSINEGKITIDDNMIEEGLFDTIGKLFKKGANKANDKIVDNSEELALDKSVIRELLNMPETGEEIYIFAKSIKKEEHDIKVYEKIEKLCKSAEEICSKLAEKEAETYKTISEKMTALNEAIKTFTEMSIEEIKYIAELSKNKISDIVATIMVFCQKMAEIAKNTIAKVGEGIVLAFSLPFIFAFSLYKGAKKVCEMLVEKVKDGSKVIKEAFIRIKNTIATWISDSLNSVKEMLKDAYDKTKEGAKNAYKAIGKAYLAVVATLGQMASDAKDKISEAYNNFINGAKEFADDVKAYISSKWDAVTSWCKKTSTAFAEGVKNVWKKAKEKVMGAVGSAKDAYQTLEDEANETWDDFLKWNDERKQESIKAKLKYAVDTWGKDTVKTWVDSL